MGEALAAAASRGRKRSGNSTRLGIRALLRLVCDTAVLRRRITYPERDCAESQSQQLRFHGAVGEFNAVRLTNLLRLVCDTAALL